MRYTPRTFDAPLPALAGEHLCLSEILSALSFGLDLTEGARPGHTLRSCLLGMRIAEAIGLPYSQRASLYYALQLKDVGCSSNAARMTALVGGDDRILKHAAKLQDWTRPWLPSPRTLNTLWEQTLPGAPLGHRLARLLKLGRTQHSNNREMIALRCERGAQMVRRLDMGSTVAHAVLHLDEHWDGSGYPDRLRGHDIPVTSRICAVAQTLDAFATVDGTAKALRVIRSRRNSWFDPQIVSAVLALASQHQLWDYCRPNDEVEDTRRAVLDLDPGLRSDLTTERVDRICEVFAEVVDTKSPFTFRHSLGVTEVAEAIAAQLDLGPERCRIVRRAALLHDIGKLSIPNSILDKQGKLTEGEWELVRQHPGLSGAILRSVPALRGVAMLAEEHHERLDGTGYPRRLTARDLSLESRVIALADVYTAMVERRPYRAPIETRHALDLLSIDVGQKLDPTCFAALEAVCNRSGDNTRAGTTPARENELAPIWA